MTINEAAEREAFEKHYLKTYGCRERDEFSMPITATGVYMDDFTQTCWKWWQARARLPVLLPEVVERHIHGQPALSGQPTPACGDVVERAIIYLENKIRNIPIGEESSERGSSYYNWGVYWLNQFKGALSAVPVQPALSEDHPLIKFLLGEGEYKGLWFGDHVMRGKYKARHWWRSDLRALVTAENNQRITKMKISQATLDVAASSIGAVTFKTHDGDFAVRDDYTHDRRVYIAQAAIAAFCKGDEVNYLLDAIRDLVNATHESWPNRNCVLIAMDALTPFTDQPQTEEKL